MTNRHERRKAKKLERLNNCALTICIGAFLEGTPQYGLPVQCYLCGAPHKAIGFAKIQFEDSTTDVPICGCEDSPVACADAVMRKFTNLKAAKTVEITVEEMETLIDKADKTEH